MPVNSDENGESFTEITHIYPGFYLCCENRILIRKLPKLPEIKPGSRWSVINTSQYYGAIAPPVSVWGCLVIVPGLVKTLDLRQSEVFSRR